MMSVSAVHQFSAIKVKRSYCWTLFKALILLIQSLYTGKINENNTLIKRKQVGCIFGVCEYLQIFFGVWLIYRIIFCGVWLIFRIFLGVNTNEQNIT